MKILRGPLGEQAAVIPPSGTTLNPSDKSASLSLALANLEAIRNAVTADRWVSARATTSKTVGKWYFEGQNVNPNIGSATACAIGLAAAAFNVDDLVSQCLLGYDPAGVSIGFTTDGQYIQQMAIAPTAQTWKTAAAFSQVAADLTARLFWARALGGLWNDSPSANPATGAGGISILSAAPLFPGVSAYNLTTPNTIICNFGASAFAGAIPAGFSAWG